MAIHALCTHDSIKQIATETPVLAYRLYRSERIREMHERADLNGIHSYILTGAQGLIDAEAELLPYEGRLARHQIDDMVNTVSDQLRALGITHLAYLTKSSEHDLDLVPYMKTIARACNQADVELNMVYLD